MVQNEDNKIPIIFYSTEKRLNEQIAVIIIISFFKPCVTPDGTDVIHSLSKNLFLI